MIQTDTSKLKPGDVVTVRGVVAEVDAALGAVLMKFRGWESWVPNADIVSIEPRLFTVGETAIGKDQAGHEYTGRIVAIEGYEAVIYTIAGLAIVLTSTLTREDPTS